MTTRHALIALALVAVLGAVACSGDQSPTAPKIDYDIDTPLLAAGKLPKVNICHLTDDGSFNVININQNAVNGHTGHGDIFPVPEEGCPSVACATIVGQATPGDFFRVTVSWIDSVNTTESYHIEFELAGGGWDNIGPATISSDPSGIYSEFVFVVPGTDTFRIVASCGAMSDPFTVQ